MRSEWTDRLSALRWKYIEEGQAGLVVLGSSSLVREQQGKESDLCVLHMKDIRESPPSF